MNIILASASPRRKIILSRLDVAFKVDSPSNNIEPEYTNDISPLNYCKKLSKIKAKLISQKHIDSLIIGADTIVTLDKTVFGKPLNKKDAYKTLNILSGQSHEVITAVTIITTYKNKANICHTFSDSTTVKFFPLDEEEILKYIDSDCPYDKAGSYGIQDYSAIFVEKINGSYDNVVGFPLSKFNKELRKINISL